MRNNAEFPRNSASDRPRGLARYEHRDEAVTPTLEADALQQRRNRVQWVYAARNNRELEARYDQWASEYDSDLTEEFEWTSPRVAVELFAKHVAPAAKILDVGAGTGLVGECLLRTGYRDLHAMDLSPGMLEVARQKNIYEKLWRMTLGERLAFAADAFDAVIGVGVFTTGHAPVRAFDELVRITKGGGHIVFSLKTDLYAREGFGQYLAHLETAGRWRLVERSAPYHPLPKGEPEVVHRVWIYRINE